MNEGRGPTQSDHLWISSSLPMPAWDGRQWSSVYRGPAYLVAPSLALCGRAGRKRMILVPPGREIRRVDTGENGGRSCAVSHVRVGSQGQSLLFHLTPKSAVRHLQPAILRAELPCA